ncbi:transposase [Blautia wexlerae]|nr:transposase [Blautia wexlerae]NSE92586.1 transposase [Blautia wexlerae]
MFAFCNRRRTSIKILQWDGFGFWILDPDETDRP